MSGGYQRPAGDGLGPLIQTIEDLKRRLLTLEIPTGTSVNSLVAQVQLAIANIGTSINAWLVANSYTKAQIDSLVANPGAIAPTTVSASGGLSAASGTFPGGVNSTDVYNRLLTYGGGFKNQYIHIDGSMGYVPSSRRFKQDIATFEIPPELAVQLRVVTFRYIAAVQNPDYEAVTEVGLIAEEVDALGLTWLVDYDDEGKPMGVKYERLALALIPWMQSIETRLAAAGI